MERARKSILWILIPVFAVLTFLLLTFSFVLDPDHYRILLQESLSAALGREVTVGKARLSWWGGPGVSFEKVRVRDRSLRFDLLRSEQMILRIKWLPLLRKQIRWKQIILERPGFHLLRDREGRLNFMEAPLAEGDVERSASRWFQTWAKSWEGSIVLRDGEIFFTDEGLEGQPMTTEIHSFHLKMSEIAYGKPVSFSLHGNIGQSKKEGYFSLSGTFQGLSEDLDLSRGKVDGEVGMRGIPISHFWPYLKRWLPMKTLSGLVDLKGHYQGDLFGAFKSRAEIQIRSPLVDYPQVFSCSLRPNWLRIDLEVEYDRRELKVSQIIVAMPEIWVSAKGRIYGIGTEEMGVDAEARSGPFDVQEGRKFVPYRIITSRVSEALFRSSGSGQVQIVSVKLSGRMGEIDHCDELTNAHVLSVEMRMDGVELQLPWKVPPLSDLRGALLFREGTLHLRGVKGRVHRSSIEGAEGLFLELLHVPRVQVRAKGTLELSDLPRLTKIEGLLSLSEDPFAEVAELFGRAHYELSFEGELKPPIRLRHHGTYRLSDVHLDHRRLPFPLLVREGRVEVTNDSLSWTDGKVDFENSSLRTSGRWRWARAPKTVEISARGRVDLKSLSSLLRSEIFRQQLGFELRGIESFLGSAEVSFSGRTLRNRFSYEAEFFPRGAYLLPKGLSTPVAVREGTFTFSNTGMRFRKMRFQTEKSFVILDGTVGQQQVSLLTTGSIDLCSLEPFQRSSFFPAAIRSKLVAIEEPKGEADFRLKWLGRKGSMEALLSEGEIRLRGVSFRYGEIPFPLSQIDGTLVLSRDKVEFVGMKGLVGNSALLMTGTLSRDAKSPTKEISFQAFSPRFDLDAILPKEEGKEPVSFEGVRRGLLKWRLRGKVEVREGHCRGLFFRDLKAEVKTEDETLALQARFHDTRGHCSVQASIEPTSTGIAFELRPKVSKMEARPFLRLILGQKMEEKLLLTGTISLDQAELRAEGADSRKMKESLSGRLRMEMENGRIENAEALGKIFSDSSLSKESSQAFESKGFAYRLVTANFSLKNGVASTEDLLLDSATLRVTAVGKVDLAKRWIDARVGIHPLVKVDAIVSRIPIAGYILTGKEKAFLSFVYEVRGEIDNPKIEAIPIKALGEGFLGILKRLLETPFRPFIKEERTGTYEP